MGTWHLGSVGVVCCLSLAAPSGGAEEVPLRASPPGQIVDAPDGESAAEIVTFDGGAVDALLATALEASIRLEDWPVAPSERQTVLVTRHDVYAPDARLVKIEAGRDVEVPRSRLVFLWGIAEGDSRTRVLVFVDPDTRSVGGLSVSPEGMHEIVPATSGERRRYLVSSWDSRLPRREDEPAWTCGGSIHPLLGSEPPAATRGASGVRTQAITSLHTLVVAVETDNELLSLKFGDDITSATDYLATLFASLNVIYERDLFVRLLQGYSILRVSSTTDPYATGGSGNASSAQLVEFASYWATNYGGVRRGLAMMLSGKQPSPNQSSGIAYLSSVCSTYSFTQVFKFPGSTGATDAKVVGHELGHNFGSEHTHCFPTAAAPVDQCYGSQPGCYSGPTGCPTPFSIDPVNGDTVSDVRGTLMSYCHLLSGCPVTSIFHPETVNVIAPRVQGQVGVCVFPFGPAEPAITGISPDTGPTGGATSFTVTGSNFQSGATVTFADRSSATAATGVTVVNSSTITATLPARPAGLTDVLVSNPDKMTGTLRDGFTFLSGPVLYSISPNSGPTTGGTSVTIQGGNFTSPATVTLGGTPATSVDVPDSTTITAVTGPHATGMVDLVVAIGGPSTTLPNAFFYAPGGIPTDFYTVSPCRLVDTRTTHPPALNAQSTRIFTVTGTCGIPSTAKAVSVNLTAVGPTSRGFFTLFPGNGLDPGTSSINFTPGLTRANNAIVLVATDGAGTIAVRNGSNGTAHFVLDVNGYFQ
jgi:hypothetical protein